jgi:sugar lactone lactonase YvrE
MRGPRGALWVRLGAKLWEYDAAGDRFARVTAPWKMDPYDALVRANGETWWVDFLKAVVVDGRSIAKGSRAYPGTDPRRFREDSSGVLWVEDFESGLFRYDDATKTFSKVTGVSAKASGVVRDDARGRWVLLHYTDGLVLKPDVGPVASFPLRELEYLRDLMLDENGDVWVGGWTGLMRLRPDGPTFGKQLFEVQ